MPIFSYLILSSVCLSMFYVTYRLLFNDQTPFKSHRYYLLIAALISITLPLLSLPLNQLFIFFAQNAESTFSTNLNLINFDLKNINKTATNNQQADWFLYAKQTYGIITIILLIKLCVAFYKIFRLIRTSQILTEQAYCIVVNSQYQNSFSFFKWIFINKTVFENNNYKKIIIHEKIHSSQFHTIDVIFFELLAALTWFNPLVWKMRNSIFLIHEYLADEGVLRTGIDRLKYQALLVNQITEERLICISSSFNHSLIKKRMIMMTKSKFNQQSKVRIWSLIPVTLMLLIVVACAKQTPQKEVEKLCIEEVQEGIKIYIVDGERVETINDIDPELIHSVDVNKKENTITVITKAYQKANFETVENLVILNGKEQGQNFDIASIDQNAIKSINVIKDKEQMKAYTSKNYDGILIIDTK